MANQRPAFGAYIRPGAAVGLLRCHEQPTWSPGGRAVARWCWTLACVQPVSEQQMGLGKQNAGEHTALAGDTVSQRPGG